MSDHVENLILEQLRAIRANQDRVSDELREVKNRLTTLELNVGILNRENAIQVGAQQQALHADDAAPPLHPASYHDAVKDRLDRIEQQLDVF